MCVEYTTDFNRWYLSLSLHGNGSFRAYLSSLNSASPQREAELREENLQNGSRRLFRLKLKHHTTGSRWYLQRLLSVLIAPVPQYTDAKRLTSRQRVSI